MSFFKRQPEYLDRQSNAAKAKSALLEKFRAKQETEDDFAKRQAVLLEIRLAREEREAKRKAELEAARLAEEERLCRRALLRRAKSRGGNFWS